MSFTRGVNFALRLSLQCPLAAANFDLLRLGFSALCQRNLQNALVVARIHLLRVHGVGQFEGTGEGAITTLNAMEVLLLLFLFKLAFALDRKSTRLNSSHIPLSR